MKKLTKKEKRERKNNAYSLSERKARQKIMYELGLDNFNYPFYEYYNIKNRNELIHHCINYNYFTKEKIKIGNFAQNSRGHFTIEANEQDKFLLHNFRRL